MKLYLFLITGSKAFIKFYEQCANIKQKHIKKKAYVQGSSDMETQ